MLKYVSNRDVFMRFYKTHLLKRVMNDTSADNEKEENMLEGLRVRAGLGVKGRLQECNLITNNNRKKYKLTLTVYVPGNWNAGRFCK